MRVEERDPATFHMDYPPQVIVDVVGHSVGPDAILRFMCAPGVKTPRYRRAKAFAYNSLNLKGFL